MTMRNDEPATPVGQWRVITSSSRFFPVGGSISIDRSGGLRVSWDDADPAVDLVLFADSVIAGPSLTQTFRRSEQVHVLRAALEQVRLGEGAPVQRFLFGFLASDDGRGDTATGVWVARDDDPKLR